MRLLFCIPLTGINDTFVQIERCWAYAKRWNRDLVIDTRISGLHCDFWELFEVRPERKDVAIEKPSTEIINKAKGLVTHPSVLTGNPVPTRQEIYYENAADRHAGTGQSLAINLETDHPESILVHVARGGGTLSHDLVKKIRLNEPTRSEVNRRLLHLPSSYISVHVRNTDVVSDYRKFFRANKHALDEKNVLVCSDDQEVVDFAADFLQNSSVFTTDVQRGGAGNPLHSGSGAANRGKEQAIEALVDLVAISRASCLMYPKVKLGLGKTAKQKAKNLVNIILGRRSSKRISGFTLLGLYLCENKNILNAFVGEP